MVRIITSACLMSAAAQVAVTPSWSVNSEFDMCKPCYDLSGQAINGLLQVIMQVGVVDSCQELCEQAVPVGGGKQTACDLVCGAIGLKAFMAAVEKSDLDPIYLCELTHSCPPGDDDAYLEIEQVAASPEVVVKGDEVRMGVQMNVTKASGVGQFRLTVNGPGSALPISQGFFLETGVPEGEQLLTVSLSLKDQQAQQGPPKTFEAGQYNFSFHLCQGECGSKHPHSIDFGNMTGFFNVSEAVEI